MGTAVLLNAEPKAARRARPSAGYGFLRVLTQNRLNLAGAILTLVLVVGAALGPLVLADPFATAPADRDETDQRGARDTHHVGHGPRELVESAVERLGQHVLTAVIRASWSRPRLSVPNQCARDGA